MLAISVSLWTSKCLAEAETETSTTEGTCKADDPGTCEAGIDDAIEDIEKVDEVEESDCQDDHPKCRQWADIGECNKNPKFMHKHCERSCLQCPDQREELRKKKGQWSDEELRVAADMGVEQRLENIDFQVTAEQTSERILVARESLQTSGLDEALIDLCRNMHEDCTTW